MPDNRLPTNQSQLDIVNKLDEIKDAIAQGGGGSGTGGHTIIDENGNSMTARAGLQFVGADVSDDAINNKTIVDLASAGGIDGVFVDTDNVIVAQTTYSGNEFTYTATEDCAVYIETSATQSGSGWVYIDDECVCRVYSSGNVTVGGNVYVLRKGQTLKATPSRTVGIDVSYAVYGIKTGTTHSKFQPVIYSFEERVIGVWTDGKPLYEKTVYIASLPSTTTQTNYAHNINNIDKIIDYEGTIQFNNATKTTAKFDRIGTSTNILDFGNTFAMIVTNENIAIIVGKDRSVCSAYVTVRYTKTTDVAGSGTWTPQGVPTHHYSTDEQVIGTWNGETLYEKTYFNVSITNQANNLVESNFDSHRVLQNFNISTKGIANTLFNYSSSINDTLFIENGDLKYYVSKTGSWWNALDKVDITIQYTKSS